MGIERESKDDCESNNQFTFGPRSIHNYVLDGMSILLTHPVFKLLLNIYLRMVLNRKLFENNFK